MILLLSPSQEGLSGRKFPSTLEKIVDFTEIRALKINGPAKVALDPVKRIESQSDALVEFSPRSSEAHRIAVGRSRRK